MYLFVQTSPPPIMFGMIFDPIGIVVGVFLAEKKECLRYIQSKSNLPVIAISCFSFLSKKQAFKAFIKAKKALFYGDIKNIALIKSKTINNTIYNKTIINIGG